MRKQLQIRDYTVGWICALPTELAAAQEMLDEEHEPILDHNDSVFYTLGRIYKHNVAITCLPGSIGTQSAATVAARMRSRFTNIRFGLMVGIGGGVPSIELDIRLGDVVVSHPYQQHGGVVQYDFGKTMAKGHIRTGWLNAPPPVLLSAIVEQRARHIRRQSTVENHLARFRRPGLESFVKELAGADVLFDAAYEHPGGPDCRNCSNVEKVQRPVRKSGVNIHYGTIASGNQVMKDGVRRDEISQELGGVMCFEMEAAGLMNDFPCLVIRGICDYADSHKNKNWQPYAAATAAACAKDILTIVPALPEPVTAPLGQDAESGQARVEMKLDLLLREVQLGYRARGQMSQDIKDELVDDNVTEIDVEENRELIAEWLKSTDADGWLDSTVQRQRNASDGRAEDQPQDRSQGHVGKQGKLSADDANDGENDVNSNKDDDLLSDAKTEVAVEYRISLDLREPRRPSYVLDQTGEDKHIAVRRRQAYEDGSPPRKSRAARGKVATVGDTCHPRVCDRAPSPAPRRRRHLRQRHDTQDHYAEPCIPTNPLPNPFFPGYRSEQQQSQPYYGGPDYMHQRGDNAVRPSYDGQYNGSHGPFQQTYPPPTQSGVRYGDGFYDDCGRFIRYADIASQSIPPHSNGSQPPPPPHAYRPAEHPPSSWPDPNESHIFPGTIFEDFLRGAGCGHNRPESRQSVRSRSPSQTRPTTVTIVEKSLAVTLEEIFTGTFKKMKIRRKTYDQATGQTSTQVRILEVPIKKGLKAGSKIKFADAGDQVEGGTQDLHFILLEKPHPLFRRSGDDLHYTIRLDLLESLCGWHRPINGIDGKRVVVGSTGPTGPTWKNEYPGLGMPKSKAPTERGNLVIEVSIDFPANPLTQEQKKALQDAFAK